MNLNCTKYVQALDDPVSSPLCASGVACVILKHDRVAMTIFTKSSYIAWYICMLNLDQVAMTTFTKSKYLVCKAWLLNFCLVAMTTA